jgi:GH25 family lysozyme M1 (1,4-beta-N-acetylmuramidase)
MARAKGIDVYHGQGPFIDWKAVKQSGVSFAMIRASYAGQTAGKPHPDKHFVANWERAKDQGLLLTAWHYFVAQRDCAEQVNFFLDTFGNRKANFPLALDFEFILGSLTPQEVTDCITQAIEVMVQRTGQKPMIYTGNWWWKPRVLRSDNWKTHDLWTAHYTSAASPIMPPDWTTWRFWQYSGSGQVPGISTNVDLDWFNGTEAELRQYAML